MHKYTGSNFFNCSIIKQSCFFIAGFFYFFLFLPRSFRIYYFFLLICTAIFLFCLFFKKKFRFTLILCVSLFIAAFAYFHFAKKSLPLQTLLPYDTISKITGVLVSNPTIMKNGNYYCTVLVHKTENNDFTSSAKGFVSLFIPAQMIEAYYPGKMYSRIKTKQRIPLIEQGLCAVFTVKQVSATAYEVENLDNAVWKNSIYKIRALSRLQLKKIIFSWGESGGLLLALLSGSRESLDTSIVNGFRTAGLSHILALSGMHVSLFTGLALLLGKLIKHRKIGLLFSLFAACLFVWFSGISPSLFRALLCSSLSILCTLMFVKSDTLSLLSFSFIIHVLFFPTDAIQISFLLSYAALLGILLLEPVLTEFCVPFIPKQIIAPFAASLAAQIFTAPFVVYFFSMLTPIGIVASVFVSPLVSLFFIIGFFSVMLSLTFPFLLPVFSCILTPLYICIKMLVLGFAQIPPIFL